MKARLGYFVGLIIASVVSAGTLAVSQPSASALPAALAQSLTRPDKVDAKQPLGPQRSGAVELHSRVLARTMLEASYSQRHYAPLWIQDGRVTTQARNLIAILVDVGDLGLRPEDYQVESLTRALQSVQQLTTSPGTTESQTSLEEQLRFELQLSTAAIALAHDLHAGRIDPRAAGFELPSTDVDLDPASLLDQLATRPDTRAVLASIEPQYLHYRLLEAALPRYRALALEPELTELPPLNGARITAGQRYMGAPALRRLLIALGCLSDTPSPDPLSMDPALVGALKQFQWLHGLQVDGALGPRTWAALTLPMSAHVRQIELTLERWRWLPPMRAGTVLVNIPEFRLFAFKTAQDSEQDMLRMDVIVGREYPRNRTPVFMADMREVVFRPYWDVPRSIVLREILPALAKNPGYLDAQHLELVRGQTDSSPIVPETPENIQALANGTLRLRQRPGLDNALGLIKFLLPNAHDVYLHDTPAVRLFAQAQRAFSHGCIRVSDPVALAQYVLQATQGSWSHDKIVAAMHGTVTQRVALAQPVHVLILYGTAVASEDGQVHFFDDIYGQDRRLEALLGLAPLPDLPESNSPSIHVHEVGSRIETNAAAGE